jgi:hypothetical protein
MWVDAIKVHLQYKSCTSEQRPLTIRKRLLVKCLWSLLLKRRKRRKKSRPPFHPLARVCLHCPTHEGIDISTTAFPSCLRVPLLQCAAVRPSSSPPPLLATPSRPLLILSQRRRCRMDLPGPTTSVGTRTDYSVGPWDYSACATRHLKAWSTRTTQE